MSAHAKDIHLTERRALTRKVAGARFTVACTAAHRDLLAGLEVPENGGARPGRVTLVHHGVDVDYFGPAPGSDLDPSPIPLVVSVGRLVPKKGFTLLIEAAARLARHGIPFRLEIVGDGPDRPRLERMIDSLELRDRVSLLGMAVRDEVRAAYRRATCFVLACRIAEDGDRDGIPNTLAEAMACGLPVVATRLPGIEELVSDHVTGRLVSPEDPEALASALAELLEHPGRARQLGMRARSWIVEHFDGRENNAGRARRLQRALGIERVMVLSADRGVPVRGHKGASIHVRSVVTALMRAGVETRILTARAGPGDGPESPAPMLEARSGRIVCALVRPLALVPGGGEALERAILRLLDNLSLHVAAGRMIASWKPDLIYERYALTAVVGARLASHLRVPLVLEVNAPLADEESAFRGLRLGWLARALEGWLLRRADRLVVVSSALHAYVLRRGVRPERVLVLPNAVDADAFRCPADAREVRARCGLDGRFVVGFCGSLKSWHGVARLLDAAAAARAQVPGLAVLIVGDGPERTALERRARGLGLESHVRFTGSVPHSQVPGYLAACDVLAAPYERVEEFYFSPLKLAEYRQTGRPVIAAAIGEIPHALKGDEDATLIEPGDTEALTDAILAHARRVPSASGASARARESWTWDDVVRRVLEAGEAARRERWAWNTVHAVGNRRIEES